MSERNKRTVLDFYEVGLNGETSANANGMF